jgi:DNA-binding NtrC family response regulator
MKEIAERINPTVLVVDDDQGVLSLLKLVLTGRGFEVLLAFGGRQAIEQYRQHQQQISLVLMDVVMPDLDGPQTLDALRRLDARVCCCFMTGDSGRYTAHELIQRGAATVFFKPFQLDLLVQDLLCVLAAANSVARTAGEGRIT